MKNSPLHHQILSQNQILSPLQEFLYNQRDKILKILKNTGEQRDKRHDVFAYIQVIQDANNEQERQTLKQAFIQERLHKLGDEVSLHQSQISHLTSKAQSDFIKPNTEILRNIMVSPFQLDDDEIYSLFLEKMLALSQHWNQSLDRVFLHAIIYTLGEYFGNFTGGADVEKQNRGFYGQNTNDVISLKEFQGKSMGVCVEKASVTHNLLKFLGVDSHLILSSECMLGDTPEAHAYILFQTKKGEFIFDPTNSVIVDNIDTQSISFYPGIYKITPFQYEKLLKREKISVEVEHIDGEVRDGKNILKDPKKRIYT